MQVIQHDITIFNGNIRAMDGDWTKLKGE
jgi:hypothetical protein